MEHKMSEDFFLTNIFVGAVEISKGQAPIVSSMVVM